MTHETEIAGDLAKLAGKRVGDAVTSVAQLCDSDEQNMMVQISALTTAAAHYAGTVAAIEGQEVSQNVADTLELAAGALTTLAGVYRKGTAAPVPFPSLRDRAGFDPQDPQDATAEAVRKAVIGGLSDSGVSMCPDNAAAVLSGLLVAVTGFVACNYPPGHHGTISKDMANCIPWAMDMARDIIGLPGVSEKQEAAE